MQVCVHRIAVPLSLMLLDAFMRPLPIAFAVPPQSVERMRESGWRFATIADQIAHFQGALMARQLSELLSVSAVTVFKMAKAGRLPSFRIGASVRFCPATIARWLRERGG